MPSRKVAHVDIIAHTRSVRRVIIVAKYSQFLSLAYGSLRYVGHQVVRYSVRILPYRATLVSTYRVEVSQEHHVPLLVSLLHIHQHLLQHRLRLSVGVGAMPLGALLRNRDDGRVAIHCSTRRENYVFAAMLAHHVKQHKRGIHIVLIVLQRFLHTLAYSLQTSKMYHSVKLVFAENPLHSLTVSHVSLIERHILSYYFTHSFKSYTIRIAEVIHHHNTMPRLVKFYNSMAADISSSASKQYSHGCKVTKKVVNPTKKNALFFQKKEKSKPLA